MKLLGPGPRYRTEGLEHASPASQHAAPEALQQDCEDSHQEEQNFSRRGNIFTSEIISPFLPSHHHQG